MSESSFKLTYEFKYDKGRASCPPNLCRVMFVGERHAMSFAVTHEMKSKSRTLGFSRICL